VVQYCDSKRDHTGRRSINGHLSPRVSANVIEQKCKNYMRQGKPTIVWNWWGY